MDTIQATTFVDTTTPMSRTKQNRIDIWRNEVALLTTADPDVPHRPGSPSSTDSPAGGSLSSSRSRSSSSIASRAVHGGGDESRTRRLLKRIGGKLTGKTREKDAVVAVIVHTRMYQEEQGTALPAGADIDEEDGGLAAVARESEDRPRGGLKDKQERLGRAARLLNQGSSPIV